MTISISSNERSAAGRALSPVTADLIKLARGQRLTVPPAGEDMVRIRNRVAGNVKSARLATGHVFRSWTEDGAIVVERVR